MIRLLRRDLAAPTLSEWVAEQRARRFSPRPIDVLGALDAVRAEYDPHHPTVGPISS
ncbi:hypothetical protein [Ornithinimicrobium kibberense]|uniref:hypothetical protein n=1 Tax=Ornithinimicrobium kibberense TaxID=282060 RepID=UPI0036184A01